MKSSYELAKERLDKKAPLEKKLTLEQKNRLAEIDSLYRSKIAEKEIVLKPRIEQMRRTGDEQSAAELERLLAHDLKKLHQEWDDQKEKIRSS